MQHTFERTTPTRLKVSFTFSAEEINAALDKGFQATRKDLALPGFRKGKAPLAVVEKRFGEDVRHRTTQDSINMGIKDFLEAENLQPLSGINLEEDVEFVRDKDIVVLLSFDVLPAIDFPIYEGLAIEQEASHISEDEIDEVIERLRSNMGAATDVTEDRFPQDGDTVDMNFEGFEQDGTPIADIKGEHFVVDLGAKQAIADFEVLAKKVKVGETTEGTVTFPEDYGHTPLAGKVVTMRISLNSLKHKALPAIDEEFAKQTGHESLEALRKAIEEHSKEGKEQGARSEAMKVLLTDLLKKTEVAIPESLLNTRIERIIGDRAVRAERGEAEVVPGTPEEQRETVLPEAMETLKPQVFLMALAHKEKLEVTEQEVSMTVYQMAMRAGQDVQKVMEMYQRSGLMVELRDRLMADKAMDMIYSKGEVTYVDSVKKAKPAKKAKVEEADKPKAAEKPAAK